MESKVGRVHNAGVSSQMRLTIYAALAPRFMAIDSLQGEKCISGLCSSSISIPGAANGCLVWVSSILLLLTQMHVHGTVFETSGLAGLIQKLRLRLSFPSGYSPTHHFPLAHSMCVSRGSHTIF